MPRTIDCVVVGYNDQRLDDLLKEHEPFKDVSGGYRHLLANSALFKGRRLKYFDLLNSVRGAGGTARDRLHVAKMPNLAVCYLVAYLRKQGLAVEYVNFFNDDQDHFLDLLQERPKAVAVTTTFYFEPGPIREITDFVNRHSPATRVVVGGPHIYNVCTDNRPVQQETMFRAMGADIFVFDSQGEDTLLKLCVELGDGGRHLDAVPNLIVREGQAFRRSARVIEHNDVEANAIDWRVFEPSFLLPTAQTRTARSCAYKCAFCRYPVMAGALEVMSVHAIEQELDALHDIGVRYLLFIDDTFNVPVNRFKEICRMMARRRYGFRWFSYFRCANADHECFDLMAEAGCAGVFLGIESGDDGVLKHMNKVASVAKYTNGIKQLNDRGILTYASFIVGYPSETAATAQRTIDFIQATSPSFFCLETFYYDPKVPIASKAADYGLTGRGYAWRHATMDWRQASDIVERGYRDITNSIMVPLYGFDLWSVAYLLGQGLPQPQIVNFLRLASKLVIGGLDVRGGGSAVTEKAFADLWGTQHDARSSASASVNGEVL